MRAILVCVDYADILAVTLPYNRHHFDDVWVVTSWEDDVSADVAWHNRCKVWRTNVFTANGAVFNKWAALEEGLDAMGRHGLLCLMDADVLWPKEIPNLYHETVCGEVPIWIKGYLYTPMRRMAPWPLPPVQCCYGVPHESVWKFYPLHPQQKEWAGYTQIFRADDPVLGLPPWHQTDWIHAGGADSFFQEKWPRERKVRPPFEVLHLGDAGVNWFGRTEEGRRKCVELWKERAARKRRGLDPFEPEKIV